MDTVILNTVIRDVLWLLIAAGWVMLVITGLETDKPLSGGIPGHVDPQDMDEAVSEGALGRLGILGGWLVFGLISATLPVVLWWIFVAHVR